MMKLFCNPPLLIAAATRVGILLQLSYDDVVETGLECVYDHVYHSDLNHHR
jgi:hypothetical protein